jgi:hypothetical protein
VLVTFETALSKDYLRELAAVMGGPTRQWVLSVGVLTALAGTVAVAGGTAWGIVGGLLTLGVSLVHFGFAATMVSRAVRESSAWVKGTFRYRLDDEGIAVESDRAGQRFGWSAITSVRSARHALHFYAGRRVAIGLPFDAMTTEQRAQIIATLVERDLLRPRPVDGDPDAHARRHAG